LEAWLALFLIAGSVWWGWLGGRRWPRSRPGRGCSNTPGGRCRSGRDEIERQLTMVMDRLDRPD